MHEFTLICGQCISTNLDMLLSILRFSQEIVSCSVIRNNPPLFSFVPSLYMYTTHVLIPARSLHSQNESFKLAILPLCMEDWQCCSWYRTHLSCQITISMRRHITNACGWCARASLHTLYFYLMSCFSFSHSRR